MLIKSFLDDGIVDFVEEYADAWYGEYHPFSPCGCFEDLADGESPLLDLVSYFGAQF